MTPPGRIARIGLPLGALIGAAATAGAAFAPWWRRNYDDPLTGRIQLTLAGGELWAAFVPLALVTVAGFGAAMISRGIFRRIVGVVIGAAGTAIVAGALSALLTVPTDAFATALTRPATPLGDPAATAAGPVLALVGAAGTLLAAVLIVTGRRQERRRSAAYEAPSVRREQAVRGAAADLAAAAESGDLWRALDSGVDPTADGASRPGPG